MLHLRKSRVWYFKKDEGGIKTMCKIVEDYANEVANKRDITNIENMFKNNGSLELAIATFKNVSEEIICKIYEDVVGTKPLT